MESTHESSVASISQGGDDQSVEGGKIDQNNDRELCPCRSIISPSRVAQVLVAVVDRGVYNPHKNVVFFPVVPELTQPLEVVLLLNSCKTQTRIGLVCSLLAGLACG